MNAPATLQQVYGHLDGQDLIRAVVEHAFPGRIAVLSSFGTESAVLLDLVAKVLPSLPVIFLDTDVLFDETDHYRMSLVRHLGLTDVRVFRPTDEEQAQAMDLWQTDPDTCCKLRKVQPLARAVAGFDALIDGRRQSHGSERASLQAFEPGGLHVKISPLWSWDEEKIRNAFDSSNLPHHPLEAQGFRSLGCWPCTRPTLPGEPVRAGRWAGSGKTECGIHKKSSQD